MSEPVPKRSSPLLTTLFVVVVLAILYALSAGPAVWFYNRSWLPGPVAVAAEVVYSPVTWVEMKTDFFETNPVGRVYWRYVDWWDE